GANIKRRAARLPLLKLPARLPQRRLLKARRWQPRDVKKFQLANVVPPQRALLARDLVNHLHIRWKPRRRRKFRLRLRQPPKQSRPAEHRIIIARKPLPFFRRTLP